jgi:hypothetical protein
VGKLVVPRIRTKKHRRSALVRSVSFFWCLVIAEVITLSMVLNHCAKGVLPFANVNSFEARKVVLVQLPILHVLRWISRADVDPSVIMRIAVSMIEKVRRIFAGHHLPYEPVGRELPSFNKDLDAARLYCSSWFPFASKLPSCESAGRFIVVEQGEESGLVRELFHTRKAILLWGACP